MYVKPFFILIKLNIPGVFKTCPALPGLEMLQTAQELLIRNHEMTCMNFLFFLFKIIIVNVYLQSC